MKTILITGSSGFIGRHLISDILAQNKEYKIIATVRKKDPDLPTVVEQKVLQDFFNEEQWNAALVGCDCVVHLVGLAHRDREKFSEDHYIKVNAEMTNVIAQSAVRARVRRFVFLSSIGVCGEKNENPFTENCIPRPIGPYAKSKHIAEEILQDISKKTYLETVIIRPPLVYGPNAPGNFRHLVKLIQSGWPLPVGGMKNLKTLCAIDNLTDFIITCIEHDKAANETFLVGDNQDISTDDLVRQIAKELGQQIWVPRVPVPLLKFLCKIIGRSKHIEKLSCSLQVDVSKAERKLKWQPKISTVMGLKKTFEDQLSSCKFN